LRGNEESLVDTFRKIQKWYPQFMDALARGGQRLLSSIDAGVSSTQEKAKEGMYDLYDRSRFFGVAG
jgi:hypothetical protein